jgi:hypothetical protein
MPDLILRTRLALLRDNLDRVARARDTIVDGQRRYEAFLSLPEQARARIQTLLKDIRDTKDATEAGEVDEVEQRLNTLETSLQTWRTELLTQKKDADALMRRTEALMPSESRRDLQAFLMRAAETRSRLGSDWASYRQQVDVCDGLFNEYVDLLRGFALRDAGFDRELFRVADHLPALWGHDELGYPWRSLTIPARAERQMPTAAKVLRIGFPEWTVWALPLLQHEFAHVFVGNSPTLRRIAFGERLPSSDSYDRTLRAKCLADATATLVTGPAYACAALLMRLKPYRSGDDPDGLRRDAELLASLQRAAPSVSGDLAGKVDRLVADWRTAIEQAGTPVAAFDAALADAHTPSFEDDDTARAAVIIVALRRVATVYPGPLDLTATRLATEWRAAVEQTGGDAGRFDELLANPRVAQIVDDAWKELKLPLAAPGGEPGWAASWAQVTTWAADLVADRAFDADASVANFGTAKPTVLALLLNAAWIARVATTEAADAADSTLGDLAERTTTRCIEVVRVLDEQRDQSSDKLGQTP